MTSEKSPLFVGEIRSVRKICFYALVSAQAGIEGDTGNNINTENQWNVDTVLNTEMRYK